MAQYRLANIRVRSDEDGSEIDARRILITWAIDISEIEAAHDITLPRCDYLGCFARHLEVHMPRLLAIDRLVAEELLGMLAASFVGCKDARLIYVDDTPANNIHIIEFFPEDGTATLTDGVSRDDLIREIMSNVISMA